VCDRERKRGEGGRGENVGLITSLCKVGDGGEGRGQWRTVKSSRVWGVQPMSAQIALFPTNGRPVVRMV
jgi:hypothetical protein